MDVNDPRGEEEPESGGTRPPRRRRLVKPYVRVKSDGRLALPRSLYYGLRSAREVRERIPDTAADRSSEAAVDAGIHALVFEVWKETVEFLASGDTHERYDALVKRREQINRRIVSELGLSGVGEGEAASPASFTFINDIDRRALCTHITFTREDFVTTRAALDSAPVSTVDPFVKYDGLAVLHLRAVLIDQVLEEYDKTWVVPAVPSVGREKATKLQLSDEEEIVVRRARERCSCIDFEKLEGTDPRSQTDLLRYVDDDAQDDPKWETWRSGRARQVARKLGVFVSTKGQGVGSASGTEAGKLSRLKVFCERIGKLHEDAGLRSDREEPRHLT